MRRHAKASPAETKTYRAGGTSRLVKLLLSAAAAVALIAMSTASATASSTHPFLEIFGSAAQPHFAQAGPLVVDQTSGDVLVASPGAGKLFRYDPNGNPDNFSALGTNTISGIFGGNTGPREVEVAVDTSGSPAAGDIYTTNSQEGHIDIFSASGASLGQLSQYETTPGNPATLTNFGETCGVAVDSTGAVYVSDYNGFVHKYVPSGNHPVPTDNTANYSYSEACFLAAGAGPTAGDIFVNSYGGELAKIDTATEARETIATGVMQVAVDPGTGHVYATRQSEIKELDASGPSATAVSTTPLQGGAVGVAVRTITEDVYATREGQSYVEVFGPIVTAPTVTAESATSVEPNSATLNGKVNPEGTAITECVFEYGTAASPFAFSAPCEGSIPTDSSDHGVTAHLTGLAANGTQYRFRLRAKNEKGTSTSEPQEFLTPVTIEATTEAATEVEGTEATLHGSVNPLGTAITECVFEYGTAASPFAFSAPCEGSIPTDSSPHTVSAKLTGLPGDGTSYIFRLSAADVYGQRKASSLFFSVDTTATIGPVANLTGSSTTFNGTVKTDGKPLGDCKFEYGTDSSFDHTVACEPAAASIPVDTSSHPVEAKVEGLEEGTTYYVRLATVNPGGTVHTQARTFSTPGLPDIAGESSIPGQSYALVGGYVDPNGSETTYRFEWGPAGSYGNIAPAGPEPSVGADSEPVPVEAKLSGLEIDHTYHFRLLATNSSGTSAGPDETFTPYKSVGLPDNRRYEQVSPVEKNQSDIFPTDSYPVYRIRAARDGNRLAFASLGGFAGADGQFGATGNAYLATRTPSGWTTKFITPSTGELHVQDAWMSFSEDLSQGVLRWEERAQTIDPNAARGMNVYLRDTATGASRLLNGTFSESGASGGFAGATPDYGKIALESSLRLTPDAPASCAGGEHSCVYEVEGETLRLASIVNESPVEGVAGAQVGSGSYENVVSEDGTRLFFSSPPTVPGGGGAIYARENGATTTRISGSERTLPGGTSGEPFYYQAAEAAHGNRVLFTTKNSLVDADTNSTMDLYMYDFSRPAGERLTLVSEDQDPEAPNGAEIDGAANGRGGVLGRSRDLRRVYFVAANQLVGGAPTRTGPKLYLWDDTGASPQLRYIATLKNAHTSQTGDIRDWTAPSVGETNGATREARVSDDGRFVTFPSKEQLTPFEHQGADEVYLYDAQDDSLACASCSADAAPATGFVSLGQGASITPRDHLFSNVSESGRLFFETSRGLLPQDTNGKDDVYEYEGGRLHLISAGSGNLGSHFIDASVDGNDVFITTEDHLVGWDEDENYDAYDARINGGFPEPPTKPPACNGDACQPAPVVPNDPTPASSGFEGAGNVSESSTSRCAKGKVRKRGRCVTRRRHRKHARQQRTATRSLG